MDGVVGFISNGYEITIEHINGRKNPCLMVKPPDENVHYKVASFNSDETADWFIFHMKKVLGRE